MCLMNGTIETEAHQTQRGDHDAIKVIEAAIFSEKPVGRFVQADETAVHQMADDEHQRHCQPDQSMLHRYSEQRFRENLFSRRDIESLDGIFRRVLAGICRSPESQISELLNHP